MPVVKVWNIPDERPYSSKHLPKEIVDAVLSVEELHLEISSEVTPIFPENKWPWDVAAEIVIEVTCLYAKPERTHEVLTRLSKVLVEAVNVHFPEQKIECFIVPFDPSTCGFWSNDMSPTENTTL